MMCYTITDEQYRTLEGLAYHRADCSYIREKFGPDEPELKKAEDNVQFSLHECDVLNIPFSAQNIVLLWAEDWRNTKREDVCSALKRRGIEIGSTYPNKGGKSGGEESLLAVHV